MTVCAILKSLTKKSFAQISSQPIQQKLKGKEIDQSLESDPKKSGLIVSIAVLAISNPN